MKKGLIMRDVVVAKKHFNLNILFAGCLVVFCNLVMPNLADAKTKKAKSKTVEEQLRLKSGNEKENDVRALKAELLIQRTEQQAIDHLLKLLKKHKGSAIEPDLLLRLAELYMRRAKSALFFEVSRESDELVSLMPKVAKNADSKKHIKNAISIYDKIETRFPRYSSMDAVLFNNAMASQQVDLKIKAQRLYWKLIKSFPQSMLVPDAYLAIGEINFEKKDFKQALKFFNAIKSYPSSRAYPYGIYKAGWTYYNLQDTLSGLKELEAVVAYGVQVEEQGIDARLDLRKEALFDMTLFFSEIYKPEEAFSYFKGQAGKLPAEPYLLRLSQLYDSHGKYAAQVTLLSDLIEKLPNSENMPEAREQLINTYENMKSRKKAVLALRDFQSACTDNGPWEKAQKTPDAKAHCWDVLHQQSLKMASKWLRLWNKNSTHPVFAESAEVGFEIYLSKPINSDIFKTTRFIYAELLFNQQKYRKASEQYSLVAQNTLDKRLDNNQVVSFVPQKFAKISHDAHYAAIVGLEKSVEKTGKAKWSQQDEDKFRELVTLYHTYHPKGEFYLDVKFKEGLIAYEKANYEYSKPIFLKLGSEFKKTEKGLKSQDLYMDILNIGKQYSELMTYTKLVLKDTDQKSERFAKIQGIYEQSFFLKVQNLQESGKNEEAIQGYREFALENNKSPLAPQAWWNVIELNYKIRRLGLGAMAAIEYADLFPKEKNVIDALIRSAQTFEKVGDLSSAVLVLDRLAKRTDAKSKEDPANWTKLAGDFYFILGDYANAEIRYLETIKDNRKSFVAQGLWKLSQIYSNQNKVESKLRIEKALLQLEINPYAAEVRVQQAKDFFAKKDYPNAFKIAQKVVGGGADVDGHFKSQARFIQAQVLLQEFEDQSLRTSVERLPAVIQLKTGKLEKAQKAFQAVISYGNPQLSIESMMKLAFLYESFVKSLREMPLPRGLTDKDGPAFREEMENLALPMEDRVVETLAQAKDATANLQVFNGTRLKIQHELDRLNQKPNTQHLIGISDLNIVVPDVSEVGS